MVIAPHELEIVKKILRLHVPQYEVRAFGSRVHRQRIQPHSDLDLVVMTQQTMNLELHAKLQAAFSASDLPFKVDVIDWAAANPSFRQLIEERYEIVQTAN